MAEINQEMEYVPVSGVSSSVEAGKERSQKNFNRQELPEVGIYFSDEGTKTGLNSLQPSVSEPYIIGSVEEVADQLLALLQKDTLKTFCVSFIGCTGNVGGP